MAKRKRMTYEDIKKINDAYYKCHSYSEVSRIFGWSYHTVKQYIIPDYKPADQIVIRRFERSDLPEFSTEIFEGVKNYGDLCVLNEEERKEIEELWKEMQV